MDSTVYIAIAVGFVTWLWYTKVRIPEAERAARGLKWVAPKESQLSFSSHVLSSPTILSHLSASFPSSITLPSSPSSYITSFDPSTGQFISLVPLDTPASISQKVTAAQSAQLSWGKSTFGQRRKLMRTLMDWVRKEEDGICRVAARDTGKTVVDAYFGEILTTLEKLRFVIEEGEDALRSETRSNPLLMLHKVSTVSYEPLGVVAALVSWNYPFHNLISPIIAALFTGNAIVVKPSELVAWSSLEYIKGIKSCIEACGFDPDIVQVVIALPDVAPCLTGDERLQHITFIGSEEVGKKVAQKAGEVGTQVTLELGGKDPCILLPSVDLNSFVPTFMRGTFQGSGQNCIGIERFIVHKSVLPNLTSQLLPLVQSLRLGSFLASAPGMTIDVGAMISDRNFNFLEAIIQEAVNGGAKLLCGGKRYNHPLFKEGYYFQPTILVGVRSGMRIANEECFGPILTIMEYETLDEAISLANDTKYGLGASVFGRSSSDCSYVISKLKCGMVSSNDFGTYYMCQSLPFGGAKHSGYGRFAGKEGLRGLCNVKSVSRDRFHGWIQTTIPPPVNYPIKDGEKGWQFVRGVGGLGYGDGIVDRAKGLWGIISAGM